jgi:hypothetical protein
MQEGRGHAVGRRMQGHFEGIADESLRGVAGFAAHQGAERIHALLLQADEALDGLGVGADFAHGVQVQLEMAVMAVVEAVVRLLAEHDLVDQPRGGRVGRGSQGRLTQVSSCCRRLVSDMKSHTANTWVSMNRRKVASESISENSGCWESACFLWSSALQCAHGGSIGCWFKCGKLSAYPFRTKNAPNKVSLQINKPKPHGCCGLLFTVPAALLHGARQNLKQ